MACCGIRWTPHACQPVPGGVYVGRCGACSRARSHPSFGQRGASLRPTRVPHPAEDFRHAEHAGRRSQLDVRSRPARLLLRARATGLHTCSRGMGPQGSNSLRSSAGGRGDVAVGATGRTSPRHAQGEGAIAAICGPAPRSASGYWSQVAQQAKRIAPTGYSAAVQRTASHWTGRAAATPPRPCPWAAPRPSSRPSAVW
jgi:hypothetical protein